MVLLKEEVAQLPKIGSIQRAVDETHDDSVHVDYRRVGYTLHLCELVTTSFLVRFRDLMYPRELARAVG